MERSGRSESKAQKAEQHSARAVGSGRAPLGAYSGGAGVGWWGQSLSPDPTGWCYSFTASAKYWV